MDARDGDRVLICGRQHVDTHLLRVGVVAREQLELSPEAVYVCRKRVTLRGQTGAELTFSEDLSGYSQCLVLAGEGGALENLTVLGQQRCPLEQIAGDWRVSQCLLRAPQAPWDAFTASGGRVVFQRCRLIGAHSVMSLYPVAFSGADTQGSAPTHVTLERCVIEDGRFSGIALNQDTSLVAKQCVFVRNGCGASQPHIELFALLAFALPKRIKSYIADFIAPGMAAQLHSPVSTTDQQVRQNIGCVLQLYPGTSAHLKKCQFGANGVVAQADLTGPWYRFRADAPHIVASENVTADGRQIRIECTLDAQRREMLARMEAERDLKGMGLAPWGVSPEEEREILRIELERNQPPWLEE